MWFNAIELQQRITQGQALVEKELQRLGKTAVNLEQLAQNLGFARADDLYVAAAGRIQPPADRRAVPAARAGRRAPRAPRRQRRERREKRQERGAGGGRGFAADAAGALLPPGAAGRHRRLCHPRPRRVHPSPRLSQLPGAGRARARARHRGGLGRDLGHVLSGGHQRARTTVPAARPVGGVRAAAPERGGREHAEPAVAGAHGVHGGSARRRIADPRWMPWPRSRACRRPSGAERQVPPPGKDGGRTTRARRRTDLSGPGCARGRA